MKTIPLTQGFVALVDDEDFERVSKLNWHTHTSGRCLYAATNGKFYEGKRQGYIYLHRFLLPESPAVDHRDGDGLNNQRYNLRPATKIQNGQGKKRKRAGATSMYRGVSLWKKDGLWHSEIKVLGKRLRFGPFDNEHEAALAYDGASRQYFGEFASPNFP